MQDVSARRTPRMAPEAGPASPRLRRHREDEYGCSTACRSRPGSLRACRTLGLPVSAASPRSVRSAAAAAAPGRRASSEAAPGARVMAFGGPSTVEILYSTVSSEICPGLPDQDARPVVPGVKDTTEELARAPSAQHSALACFAKARRPSSIDSALVLYCACVCLAHGAEEK